ncbi:MAG: helix-turn-helix domain-containing protein, partial [Nostocoides sp.]
MATPEPRASPLTDLGLTAYEARAYLALITRDRYTAAELARQAGIPRQRVYDVLDGLVRRGLAAPVQGAVRRFTATSPDAAVELLVATRRDELNALSRDASVLA